MSVENVSGTFIEGVGDDLVAASGILFAVVVAICFIYWRWYRAAGGAIHEESESLAGDVRQQMRSDRSQQPSPTPSDPDGQPAVRVRFQTDIRCPICFDDNVRYGLETNCGHVFCGQCIVTWWQQGRWTGAAKCPVCRQQVTILFHYFTEQERQTVSEEKQVLMNKVHLYNRRYSGQPVSWREYIHDLPTMLRHCMADFFSLGGLMVMFRVRIIVCFVIALLYLISPLDIIPEAVFGFFGLLDDFFIVVLLAIYITIIYRRFIVVQAQDGHQHTD